MVNDDQQDATILAYSSEISPTRCNNRVFILRNGFKSKAIAENKNAIVASCWTYFTTIKRDARNHKY